MAYTTRYVDYRVVEFLKKISEKHNIPLNWWLEEKLTNLSIEEAKKIKRSKHQWFGRLKISPKNIEMINKLLIEINKDRERSSYLYMNDVLLYIVEKYKNEIDEKKKEGGGIFQWFS